VDSDRDALGTPDWVEIHRLAGVQGIPDARIADQGRRGSVRRIGMNADSRTLPYLAIALLRQPSDRPMVSDV
jgi:hypothetical protein